MKSGWRNTRPDFLLKNGGRTLANEENLIPMDERTENEQREIARKGGKSPEKHAAEKRHESQNEAAAFLQPTASQSELLKAIGIPEEDADNEMLLLVAMFQAVTEDRDTKAFDKVMDVLGKTVQREELTLKKRQAAKQDKPSNGMTEQLIAGMQEQGVEDDLHEEAAAIDGTVANKEVAAD